MPSRTAGDALSHPPGGEGTVSYGIHDLVSRWVASRPNACAVQDATSSTAQPPRELTYRELWRRAGWLAEELSGRGVGRGDLVAVAIDRSVDLVVALLGIIRAGAAYLPLDSYAPPDRIATILADSRTELVVCAADAGAAGERRAALPLDARSVPLPLAGPDAVTSATVTGDDPIYVAFTSGSTGRPKGVVVPHRAVKRLVEAPNYCVIAAGDRVANLSNPAFDATTFEIWSTLTAGGTVVVFPSLSALSLDDWTARVRAEGITTMFLTTSLFHTVAWERPGAFAGLANLVVGGEQMDLAATRRVLNSGPPGNLVNGYGPTETTTFAAYYTCTTQSLCGLDRVPIGFPLQNTTHHVVDAELRPVAPGETGELCIGGPGVATGYLNRPELTAERFVVEPGSGTTVYRTGDLVRRLPNGALELLGRRDRQVKLRGFRIELEEIERAATATGLVDSAFVEKLGEGPAAALVAFVLPRRADGLPDGDLPGRLTRQLARHLPGYMLPSRWIVLSELPIGATGKADRAQMLALLDQPPSRVDDAAAGDGVPEELRLAWLDVLAGSTGSAGENFLELGGNSILAVQLASRLEQRLAVRVEPADILLAASLGELATHLARHAPLATHGRAA